MRKSLTKLLKVQTRLSIAGKWFYWTGRKVVAACACPAKLGEPSRALLNPQFSVTRDLTRREQRARDNFLKPVWRRVPKFIHPNLITAVRLGLTGLFFVTPQITPGAALALFITRPRKPRALARGMKRSIIKRPKGASRRIKKPSGVSPWFFIFCALGDAIDGALARRRRKITSFGKVLDPTADIILAIGAIWYLWPFGILPLGLIIVLAISYSLLMLYGGWIFIMGRRYLPNPNFWGRLKSILLALAILLYLLALLNPHTYVLKTLANAALFAAGGFAYYSLIMFWQWVYTLWRGRRFVDDLLALLRA